MANYTRGHKRLWAQADLAEIIVLRQRHRMPFKDIAARFPGRTVEAIKQKLCVIGRYNITGNDTVPQFLTAPSGALRTAAAALAAEISAAKREARTAPLYRGWPE